MMHSNSKERYTFRGRKAARTEYYEKFVKGWKLRKCGACNGSGYYDHNGSPDCGACDGTGKERYKPQEQKDD
jgi:DnaJ-class molecular chaperone